VNTSEFSIERKNTITLSKNEIMGIDRAYDFIWNFQRDENYSLSRVDVLCLSTAYTLNIPIVTDDYAMSEVAEEYEILVFSTLKLLKLMLDEGHISMEKVKEIVEYWKYMNDLPINFLNDYEILFQ